MYLRNYNIVVENCDSAYIRKWNRNAQAMDKKTKQEVLKDIRMYFQSR